MRLKKGLEVTEEIFGYTKSHRSFLNLASRLRGLIKSERTLHPFFTPGSRHDPLRLELVGGRPNYKGLDTESPQPGVALFEVLFEGKYGRQHEVVALPKLHPQRICHFGDLF